MLTKRMTMWRMNEMCRRMALTLVFYVLLFHTCQGQSDSSMTTAAQTTAMEGSKMPQSSSEGTAITASTILPNSPTSDADKADGASDTPIMTTSFAGSTDQQMFTSLVTSEEPTSKPLTSISVVSIIENEIKEHGDNYQTELEPDTGSANQTQVFVPVLLSGLILAAALIGIYVWKHRCRAKQTGMKLAEESYMADEENQGNTLVSVAPLNPPENQEKPSQNGESLEAVKTQNPPAATNGHSTAKADTEL
ncbi:hypothetical protein KOW79_012930 [Hemibagrus wyckioides]|uniref:Uncharacterized protein n=1 Tax=Hemibagrus wyckioides TaxID=337641 RepID=A0A9D3NHX6_9TELE|nr:uncharacterized protein cd34 [Hemibagrus wyckioides]KAG7323228.1 hypothetical protein KOW79_012930 [Hemibagrus wyckioides]